MEPSQLLLFIICTVFAIIGLVLVFLQKKGILKSFLSQDTHSVRAITGGKVMALGTLFGTILLGQVNVPLGALYALLLVSAYLAIHFLVKKA